MSRENVEVVLKQFTDTNARDFAAVMEAYSEDVMLVMHGEKVGVLGRSAAGKAAVGEWFGDWFRQFGRNYRFDIEETRGVGDRVFLVATHHGRGRDSGVPVEERWAYVYTVRGGKVSRVELWGDRDAREAALEALGPS
ncbi:MAG TPA: nuclear transport factor 2 family protein [Thermoleophilaceae bacterium]|nr:nuclear transport factor 2 family protein [Thermoleophilaceae bacterium]